MPQLQEINATYSPDSKLLKFDPDLKLSCLNFESFEKLLSDSLRKELSIQVNPSSIKIIEDKRSQLLEPFSYPTTCEYAELAARVYDEKKRGGKLDYALPKGWRLLTTAYNHGILGRVAKTNGYFGAAYWNFNKQQVVIAHRGTDVLNTGSLRTDFEGIYKNQHTPQMDSAITFAYKVAKIIQKINNDTRNCKLNIQLSFTGHSLGGWLAQITTFATKYLKLVEVEKEAKYFLKDEDFQINGLHAHTVVFDSPGCQKTLLSLRDTFDVRYGQHHEGRDSLFLDNLDITVYLSGPNLINACNRHVGTLYRVSIDLSAEQRGVDIPLYYTLVMHKMTKIKEALSDPVKKNEIRKILDWPLLGKQSSTSSGGFLEYALDQFVKCSAKFVDHTINKVLPLPIAVNLFGFAYQKYKSSKEYTEIFEFLKKINDFHANQQDFLSASGYAKIRYQEEPIIDQDKKKCPRNMFTDIEWKFLVRYEMLRNQPNSSSTLDQFFARVFGGNETEVEAVAVTVAIAFLSCFTTSKERVTVDECEPEEFISYVKHLLSIFPELHDDKQLKAFNIRYQSESLLYIQSRIIDFFKKGVKQSEASINEHSHFIEGKPVDLNKFLVNKESRILHTIQPDLCIGVNVIYDLYLGWLKGKEGYGKDRHAFFNLGNILDLNFNQFSAFLASIKPSPNDKDFNNPYLFVIECELSDEKMPEREEFFKNLFDILKLHSHIKLILVGREDSLSSLIYKETRTRFGKLFFELYGREPLEPQETLKLNFDDLTYSAQNKLLESEIIFQGEEVALGKLINRQDDKIKEVIDSETLVTLIKNEKIELGKPVPPLGAIKDYYIDREFYHQVKLKKNVLSEYSKDKFFIVNMRDNDELLDFAQPRQIKYFSEIKQAPVQYNQIKFILLDDAKSAEDDFKYLCEIGSEQTIHWLIKGANGDLVWHQSQGSMLHLRKHMDKNTDPLIKDKEIIEKSGLDNKLIIIAAEPGMGKSTVLTYLANKEKEKDIFKWVLRVDLLKCKEKLNQNQNPLKSPDDIIRFLSDINSIESGLSTTLLKYFIENKGKLVLLLDGYDEIEKNQQNKVIKLIEGIKKTEVEKIIISTRLHERENLEDKLSVFSYTFREFDSAEQREFLQRFWEKNIGIEAEDTEKKTLLGQYIGDLLVSFSESLNNAAKGFMGIPLQTKMIAEIFQSDIQQSLDDNDEYFESIKNFGTLELYEHFVQCKYDLYFKEKLGISVPLNPMQKRKFTSSFTKMHRRLAMRLLFPSVSEGMQDLIGIKFLSTSSETEELNLIGLIQVISNKVSVTHRSYAEYFAADLLNDMLQRKHSPKYESTLSFLSKEIFKPQYEVIRIFLDGFLTSKKTVYEKCLEEIKHKLDTPHDIPSEELVNSLHDATAKEARFSDLNTLIKALLKELAVERTSNEKIDDILMGINHCVNSLSAVASHNRKVRYAASEGNLVAVNELLFIEPMMDVGDTDNMWKAALHYAAQKGNEEIVPALLAAVNELLENPMIDVDDTDNIGRTALHYAAQKGHTQIVSALLREGFKIEALDRFDRTALHYAARYNDQNTQTIACLLEYAINKNQKAIINQKDKEGFTALYYAAKQGYWHLVSALIEKGANSDGVLNKGELLFHFIFEKNLATIKSILTEKTEVTEENNINQYRDNQKNGLLHIAAQRGCPEIIGLLLEQGLDIQARNKNGERPINIAAQSAHWEIVTRLLTNDKPNSADFYDLDHKQKDSLLKYSKENKCLINLKFFFEDGNKDKYFDALNFNNQEKIDLFCQFVSSGYLGVITFFINKGTKIDTPDSDGKTPIQHAAEQAYWNIVELFLVKKAALLDNLSKKDLGSLFNYSVERAHLNIIKLFIENANGQNYFNDLTDQQRRNYLNHLIFVGAGTLEAKKVFINALIEKGIDINSQDGDGKTLLHQAAQYQQLALVRYLVEEKQADIHTKDDEGHTPLYDAAVNTQDGNVEVIKYLLEKEACRELSDKLLYATQRNYKAAVEALLTEEGADVDVRDNNGGTPLHWATFLGYMNVARSLIRNGANVKVEMANKCTLLHLTAFGGHEAVVKLLIENGANVKATMANKCTPLHLAALGGHEVVTKLLIEEGAAVDAKDADKDTPLHLAAFVGHEAVAKLLIEKGAVVDGHKNIPLYWAAAMGHLAVVKLLIENGANVKAEMENKCTPLHLASLKGHEAVAKLLIEEGAAVDAKDADKNTPLHWAAQDDHLAVVKVLIENGAEINVKDQCKRTPLHWAAKDDHLAVVKVLIENGAEVNVKDQRKRTPLHLAAENAHLEMVKYLAEQDADVHTADKDGFTPLSSFIYIRSLWGKVINVEVVKYLLEKEAGCELPYKLHYAAKQGYKKAIDTLLAEEGADVDARDDFGATPLHLIAEKGHLGMVKYLVDKKRADVRATDQNGHTPLYSAAKNTQGNVNVEVVKYLLEKEAGCELPYKLHYAAKQGYSEVVVALLTEEDADIDARNDYGATPLHVAAQAGHEALVKVLIENGAMVNAENNRKWTPLHVAVHCLAVAEQLVEALIKRGREAAVDAKDSYARTPLHVTATNGHLAVAELLIKNGAMVNAKDKSKWTPLYLAAHWGHLTVAKLLIKNGAMVNAEDNDKMSPLHQAALNGHLEMVRYLFEQGADIHAENQEDHTPLYCVAKNTWRKVNVEVVKYLLEKEAGHELPYKLHYAAEQGYKEVLEALLMEEGANVDARNNLGETLLHLAAEKGHLVMVKYLVDKKRVGIRATDQNGHTPLYYAAKNTWRKVNVEVVKYLLEKEAGCELSYKLHYAVEQSYKEVIVALLTEEGTDIDARNNQGKSSLHLAVAEGREDVAALLIEKKANVNAEDDRKHTPLHLAAAEGNEDVAALLIEKKANVNAEDDCKYTPLHLAAAEGHKDIMKLLIKSGAEVDVEYKGKLFPLYLIDKYGEDIASLLIKNKANVNAEYKVKLTHLYVAAENGHIDKVLIKKKINVQYERFFFNQPNVTFFKGEESDDELQNQSHSTQQPHYGG